MDQTAIVEGKGLRFARRMRNIRLLGYVLASISVATVLGVGGAPAWLYGVLAATMAWPFVALEHARRAQDPVEAEFGNIRFDSIVGGFWIGAMGLHLLPSVLIVAMMGLGETAVGGVRSFLHGLAIKAVAAAAVLGVFGFPVQLHIDPIVLGCLPFVVAYPIAMSFVKREIRRKMKRQKELLDRLVCTDGLTGLATRQHWEWWAEKHWAVVAEGHGPAALVMIDVDHFKEVNDRYGHLLGDEVIATVAATLRQSLRAQDVGGRYAGDEFAIVMPGAGLAAAREVAERFRAAVSKLRFPGAPTLRCTVSIGIAIATEGRDGLKGWIHRADQALYESKGAGRNRVSSAAEIPEVPETVGRLVRRSAV